MNKIFKNKYTRIILGILWGLGLSCIFREACNGRKCVIYKAPNKLEVKDKVFANKKDKKCYKFKTEKTECTKDAIL
jgi:hypothetical protein